MGEDDAPPPQLGRLLGLRIKVCPQTVSCPPMAGALSSQLEFQCFSHTTVQVLGRRQIPMLGARGGARDPAIRQNHGPVRLE